MNETKVTLNKPNNTSDKPKHKIGNWYKLNSSRYEEDVAILVQTSKGTCCFIIVSTTSDVSEVLGSRWAEPVEVSNPWDITEEEISKMLGTTGKSVELIKEVQISIN